MGNGKSNADIGALLLRIALGVMYLEHGYMKLVVWGPEGTANFFASIGMPAIFAYGTIAFELLGGLILLVGVKILTRLVAFLAFIQLLVITYVDARSGFEMLGSWEYPLFMAIAALALFFMGIGRYSIIGNNVK